MEHDCDGRLGRYQVAGRTIPAEWKFQRADTLWAARGHRICESNRNRTDRKAAPADGGLYFGRVGQAGSDFMDIAESSAALRNRHGECSSSEAHGIGKLAVEREENPHSRRRAIEAADFHAVLCA